MSEHAWKRDPNENGTCAWCGRKGRAFIPNGADGTATFPFKHKDPESGEWCQGRYHPTLETENKQDISYRRTMTARVEPPERPDER